MTTSSARPELLRSFAVDLAAQTERARTDVDAVTRAMARYRAGCGAADPVAGIDWIARNRLDRARHLATSVGQIAQAFTDADGGIAGSAVSTPTDSALARAIDDRAPGLSSGLVLAPTHTEDGRRLAASLGSLSGAEAADRTARLDQLLTSEAMAAGFVNELGTEGLVDLYESITEARRNSEIDPAEFDRAMVALAGAFSLAGGPSRRPTMPAAPGGGPLDLEVIDGLGDSSSGRMLIRHISISGSDMAPGLVGRLAGAAFHGSAPPTSTLAVGHVELLGRLADQGRAGGVDLPLLGMLRADPRAATAYENASPPGTSRLATHLTRRNPEELVVSSDILRARYITPAAADGVAPWTRPGAGEPIPPIQARTDAALRGSLGAVQGMDDPPRAVSLLLVDFVGTHPAFFDDVIADQAFETTAPSTRLRGYFEVIARQPEALDRGTALVIDRSADQASASIATLDPVDVAADQLRADLDAPRQIGHYVQDGAFDAGQRHHAVAGLGLSVATYGTKQLLGRASKAGGPATMLGSYLIKPWIGLAGEGARTRYVDTNDGRDELPAEAMDRSLPFVAAAAMMTDDRWRHLLHDPDQLAGLDVVASDADWRAFTAWLSHQPPVVQDTLRELISVDRRGE